MKLSPGTTTIVPASPAGPTYTGQVSADGNTLVINGLAYVYSGMTYSRRRWEPNGPWDSYFFRDNERYDKYEQDAATGNHIWTETGTYYQNG